MSLTMNGRTITCDGAVCEATTRFLVALRPSIISSATPAANGWLYVLGTDHDLHFCPVCSPKYLRALSPAEATEQTDWMTAE